MRSYRLTPNANQLLADSLEWLDARWDPSGGIRLDPARSYRGNTQAEAPHYVRETACYALGLFWRGDLARAQAALELVLSCQLKDRDTEFAGTFLRHPEEPRPSRKPAREWIDYTPNWREHVGAILAMILCEFAAVIPEELRKQTEAALRRATVGSLWRRVPAEYTHIALIKAFLLAYCGVRHDLEAWLEGGEMQGAEIFRVFKLHGCFPNFNSPTDNGLALLALAMWRKYAPSTAMKSMAEQMETALWNDLGQFYHPGMRNLAGPYDRAFGMDLAEYASPLGLCIWASVGRQRAPFPELSASFAQEHELALGIPIALAGVAAPPSIDLISFHDRRQLNRRISGPVLEGGEAESGSNHDSEGTVVSAWMEEKMMAGAMARSGLEGPQGSQRRPAAHFLAYPATLHWTHDSKLGWISAHFPAGVIARAEERRLTWQIGGIGTESQGIRIRFQIQSPGQTIFALDKWTFPGLTVLVSTNLLVSAPAERGGLFEIECTVPETLGRDQAFLTLSFQL